MYTYTPAANGVLRSDGATVPADPLNTDYQAYLAWIAAGNTPIPAGGTSTLAAAQQVQIAALSAACAAAILAGFTSNALGAQHTYPAQIRDQLNLASSYVSAMGVIQDAVPWVANAMNPVGALVSANGQVYVNLTQGASAPTPPTWPTTVGTIELDGAAQWKIWTTPFWCEDGSGNWARVNHTASQIKQAGNDGKAAILALMEKCDELSAQVMAAPSPAAVAAINWS